jgi:hypothetical protein
MERQQLRDGATREPMALGQSRHPGLGIASSPGHDVSPKYRGGRAHG